MDGGTSAKKRTASSPDFIYNDDILIYHPVNCFTVMNAIGEVSFVYASMDLCHSLPD